MTDTQYRTVRSGHEVTGNLSKKIWIDLDNTPHVPFFRPIIRELETKGYTVVVTARDAFQVCELAERTGLKCQTIGRHYGKNSMAKVLGLLWRSWQLLPFVLHEKPDIAVSHGARSQILLGNVIRIPTVLIIDYEHAKNPPFARPKWEIVPKAIPVESLYAKRKYVRQYSGIKEDVYAGEFKPDPTLLSQLGLVEKDLIVTVRPPANEAHYHNPESEALFIEFMNRVTRTPDAKTVLLPRNKKQESEIRRKFPAWFQNGKVIIPPFAIDGLNLLWHSDLVVSGGGTMNREAAALGVPVYSIFRGPIGAVDLQLQAEQRLVLVKSVSQVHESLTIAKREKKDSACCSDRTALSDIVGHIHDILELEILSKDGVIQVPNQPIVQEQNQPL